jgi:hypothetical protein
MDKSMSISTGNGSILARLRSTGVLKGTVASKTIPVSPAKANMREWTEAEWEAEMEKGVRAVNEGCIAPDPAPSPVTRRVVPVVTLRTSPVVRTNGLLARLRQQGVRMSVR